MADLPHLDEARRLSRIGLALDEIVRMLREAELTENGVLEEWTAHRLLKPAEFKTVCGGIVPTSSESKPTYSLYRQLVLAQRDWDAYLTKGVVNKYRPSARVWDRAQGLFYFDSFSEYTIPNATSGYSSDDEVLPDIDHFCVAPGIFAGYKKSYSLTRISLVLKEARVRLRLPKGSTCSHDEFLQRMTASLFSSAMTVQGKLHKEALGVDDVSSVSFLTLAVLARRTYRDFLQSKGTMYPSLAVIKKCAKKTLHSEDYVLVLYDNPMALSMCSDNESEWEDVDGLDGASWASVSDEAKAEANEGCMEEDLDVMEDALKVE